MTLARRRYASANNPRTCVTHGPVGALPMVAVLDRNDLVGIVDWGAPIGAGPG